MDRFLDSSPGSLQEFRGSMCSRAKRSREPAIVVDATTAHDVEKLCFQLTFGFRVVEGVSHACPVEGFLWNPVHRFRWCDVQDFVKCRRDVYHVMELAARCIVLFQACGP